MTIQKTHHTASLAKHGPNKNARDEGAKKARSGEYTHFEVDEMCEDQPIMVLGDTIPTFGVDAMH